MQTDVFESTNITGVYASEDNINSSLPQIINAVCEGCKAAMGVISDLIHSDFKCSQ